MDCNNEFHEYLNENGDMVCPICFINLEEFDEKPQDNIVKYIPRCENQDIINDNNELVCQKCGIVQGYETVREYVNFYDNKHKLKRKSHYCRKYHINNTILDIKQEYKINISCDQKCKIDKVFTEIGKIISEVNGTRKRMISIYFILRKVLSMMNLSFDKIPISKSKQTLKFYNEYWAKIMSQIGDEINNITK